MRESRIRYTGRRFAVLIRKTRQNANHPEPPPSLRFRGGPASGAPLWLADWPRSRPNSGTAKTGVVEAVDGAARVAARRPHEARDVAPGPAAQDAERDGIAA